MSVLPHVCRCGQCGREFVFPQIDYSDPRLSGAAPAPDFMNFKTFGNCSKCNGFHDLSIDCSAPRTTPEPT